MPTPESDAARPGVIPDSEFPDARTQEAAEAVTEFVTVAFQPEFLIWEKEVNLAIAEMVWNLHSARVLQDGGRGRGDEPIMGVAPHLEPLQERLAQVRRARWPDATWMVFALEARVEAGEIVFTFDLTFDEGHACQPCEMTWVQRIAGSHDVN